MVFDEAHHCTKNHPYNKLLVEHHLVLPPEKRPKVLGLTASPAGRPTKEETLNMLTSLLTNLGRQAINMA
jgi:ERCC4-related helicase